MDKAKRWIDESIDISDFEDRLSSDVREMMEWAAEAEQKQEEFTFYEACDNVEIHGKILVEEGIITEEEWNRLCEKYYPVVD